MCFVNSYTYYSILKIPNDKCQITNNYQITIFKKTKKEAQKQNIY